MNSKQHILTSNSSSASRCDCKMGNVFNNCNQTQYYVILWWYFFVSNKWQQIKRAIYNKNPRLDQKHITERYTHTHAHAHTHAHTHTLNGPFSGTTLVSLYQKNKTNLNFTEARDSEWQWHRPGHMQVCTSIQTDNHAIPHRSVFLQARCSSSCPTNTVNALKANITEW